MTWSEGLCPTGTNPESTQISPQPSDTADDPVLSSSSGIDDVRAIHFRLQNTKENATKMRNASGLTIRLVSISDNAGQVLNTASNVVLSVKVFIEKCKTVSDCLDFVVHAVNVIAEACMLLEMPVLTDITNLKVHPYAKIAWSVISFIPMVEYILQ